MGPDVCQENKQTAKRPAICGGVRPRELTPASPLSLAYGNCHSSRHRQPGLRIRNGACTSRFFFARGQPNGEQICRYADGKASSPPGRRRRCSDRQHRELCGRDLVERRSKTRRCVSPAHIGNLALCGATHGGFVAGVARLATSRFAPRFPIAPPSDASPGLMRRSLAHWWGRCPEKMRGRGDSFSGPERPVTWATRPRQHET